MDSSLMHALFFPGVSILEKILRPVIVYFFLIAGLRLAGKRELAQLNAFDLVVLLTISNTVQNAIIGNDNSVMGGLIGATTLLLVNYIVVRFLYTHATIDRIVEGSPVALIENGRILKNACRKELITLAELEEAAHKQGFDSLDSIERAVLEPGGTMSFIKKETQPEAPRPQPQPQPAHHPAQHDDARYQEVLQRLDSVSRDVKTALGMIRVIRG